MTKKETAVASIARLDGRPKTAVPNVSRAVPVRLALGAQIAPRVNTVRVAITMPLRVLVVPLVLAKVIQGKLRAYHAVPVNSAMLWVLLVANCVSTRRTLVKKKETAVASIAPSVGLPKTAVRNVLRAVRARSVLGVKIACRVNTVRVAIQMLLRALIVPLVLVKVTQGKRRAFPAVPVNSTILLVMSSANFV